MTPKQIEALFQLSEWVDGERLVFDIPHVGECYISRVNLTHSFFRIYYPLYSVDLHGYKPIPSTDIHNLRYMYHHYMNPSYIKIF